jgi:hypothetical protein
MGLPAFTRYLFGMSTEQASDALARRPFDRVGIAALAWTVAFIALTGLLALTLR